MFSKPLHKEPTPRRERELKRELIEPKKTSSGQRRKKEQANIQNKLSDHEGRILAIEKIVVVPIVHG